MKSKKIASALVAFILFASSLTGCSLFGKGGEGGDSSPLASSSKSSSSADSVVSSQPSDSSSQPNSSTAASSSSVKPTSSDMDQQVLPIETNDKEFDAYFKKNPLDAAYISDLGNAYSNTAITKLNEDYRKNWNAEIDSAYQKLLEKASDSDKETFKAEQLKWVNATPSALKKISKDALAGGGNAPPQVEASSKIMEYYRARAAQVYKELYGYDKNYTYVFKK